MINLSMNKVDLPRALKKFNNIVKRFSWNDKIHVLLNHPIIQAYLHYAQIANLDIGFGRTSHCGPFRKDRSSDAVTV